MGLATTAPIYMGAALVNSGYLSTGEYCHTNGGQQNACIWSGALAPSLAGCPSSAVTSGGHVLIAAGHGRLHKIVPHQYRQSGQPVWFYDAGAITVSGISVSGQRIIGFVPPRSRAQLALASGEVDTSVAWQDVIDLQMPFTSGLCVAAASGAPGFTVSYTLGNTLAGVGGTGNA